MYLIKISAFQKKSGQLSSKFIQIWDIQLFKLETQIDALFNV